MKVRPLAVRLVQPLMKVLYWNQRSDAAVTAQLCLDARDAAIPMPFAQMLLYPVLDRRMNTESYRKFVDTPLCNSENMKVYWKLYGGDGCSPMEEKCLEGLPPAYVETAEFDSLHRGNLCVGCVRAHLLGRENRAGTREGRVCLLSPDP